MHDTLILGDTRPRPHTEVFSALGKAPRSREPGDAGDTYRGPGRHGGRRRPRVPRGGGAAEPAPSSPRSSFIVFPDSFSFLFRKGSFFPVYPTLQRLARRNFSQTAQFLRNT